MGQHFIVDPNLARAVASDSGVGPGDRVVEVGAGLGALTIALAETGADVLAVEFDRALVPALEEAIAPYPNVAMRRADALRLDWPSTLGRDPAHPWTLCANLPYNIAVPLVMGVLEAAPMVERLVVIVQREVGDRLVARPGDERYAPASVRVAYHANTTITRRVPASVFWPRPKVESVVVALDRRSVPPVDAEPERLWRVVDAGFAARRKTMRNALIRLGVGPDAATDVLGACAVGARARAQELSLERFACIAGRIGEPPR
jgi:16S rRNA (adenine1518-N6/adenine1519-N6)-dimethyltransferase